MTRFNTQLVHGLPVNDNNTGAVNPPIYNSSTYAVESVNAMPRWDYARSGNPTRGFLEKQIAQLEHGTRGFAFASGLAAIHAVLSIFKPGDRIVVGKNIYGGTYSLFNEYFAERGLEFDSVDTADYEALDAAISGRDRGGRAASAVYFETLTNPAAADQQRQPHLGHRAPIRRAVHRRQHVRHPVPAAAARFGRGYRHPFGHQIPGRPFRGERRPCGGVGR